MPRWKWWLVIIPITIIVLLIFVLSLESSYDTEESWRCEYVLEIRPDVNNGTSTDYSLMVPIPLYKQRSTDNISISGVMEHVEVIEGEAEIMVVKSSRGPALLVNGSGSVVVRAYHRGVEKNSNIDVFPLYLASELSMMNTSSENNQPWHFVHSSTEVENVTLFISLEYSTKSVEIDSLGRERFLSAIDGSKGIQSTQLNGSGWMEVEGYDHGEDIACG